MSRSMRVSASKSRLPAPIFRRCSPTNRRRSAPAASVASCLAASLLFALEKQRVDPQPVAAHIDVDMVKNDAGRVRVGAMAVTLSVGKAWADLAAATRMLDRFDAYCVVTESMREGIPVSVAVQDVNGAVLDREMTGV